MLPSATYKSIKLCTQRHFIGVGGCLYLREVQLDVGSQNDCERHQRASHPVVFLGKIAPWRHSTHAPPLPLVATSFSPFSTTLVCSISASSPTESLSLPAASRLLFNLPFTLDRLVSKKHPSYSARSPPWGFQNRIGSWSSLPLIHCSFS